MISKFFNIPFIISKFNFLFFIFLIYFLKIDGLYFFLANTLSIIAHEYCHVYFLIKYGVEVNEVKLSTFGGHTKYNSIDFNKINDNKKIVVLISASIINLILGFFSFGIYHFINLSFFKYFYYINFIMFFNILPILSFDGHKAISIIIEKK